MIQALTLIAMSLQLLILAANPAIPSDMKKKASDVANFALEVGNKALKDATTESVASSVATSSPVVSIPPTASSTPYIPVAPVVLGNVTPAPIPVPEVDKSELLVKVVGPLIYGAPHAPYGEYHITVQVLDKAGNLVYNAPVRMSAPDNADIEENERTRHTINTTGNNKDWQNTFTYRPTSAGKKTIVFTSNLLTKESP